MGIEIADKSKETRVKHVKHTEISIWTSTQMNIYTEEFLVLTCPDLWKLLLFLIVSTISIDSLITISLCMLACVSLLFSAISIPMFELFLH